MPRAAKDKIQQGSLRRYPWQKLVDSATTGTPAAASYTHLFQAGPSPAAGAYAGSALAKQQVVGGTSPTVAGGYLTTTNPTSPAKNFLTKATLKNLIASGKGTLYLLDMLVTYNGFNANSGSAQPTTGATAGTDARPRTANDRTILLADVTTDLGATPRNAVITYTSTKSGLPSGRSTTIAFAASTKAWRLPHSYLFIPLQADDPGVASVQNVTMSGTMGAGVFTLMQANLLAELTIDTDLQETKQAFANDTDAYIEVPSNAALTLIWSPVSATADQRIGGIINLAEADLDAA